MKNPARLKPSEPFYEEVKREIEEYENQNPDNKVIEYG